MRLTVVFFSCCGGLIGCQQCVDTSTAATQNSCPLCMGAIRDVLSNFFKKIVYPTPHNPALYTLSAQRASVLCGSCTSVNALLTPDESSATGKEYHR